MKKIISVIGTVVFAGGLLVGCGQEEAQQTEESMITDEEIKSDLNMTTRIALLHYMVGKQDMDMVKVTMQDMTMLPYTEDISRDYDGFQYEPNAYYFHGSDLREDDKSIVIVYFDDNGMTKRISSIEVEWDGDMYDKVSEATNDY